jgi:hypothetical protein
MKFLQIPILLLVFTSYSLGEPIRKVSLPLEVRYELRTSDVPREIEGKVWNRWTSENFTVLSLSDIQAQYLHKHLELVKVWTFSRWGLYDTDFSAECKLICVDDPALFEKMFKLTRSKVEIRLDSDGEIKETVIFLLVNEAPSHTVPVPLMEVCLAEFSQKYDANFGMWAYRGMSLLNAPLDQIREDIYDFAPLVAANKPIFFGSGLFTMGRDQYSKSEEERQELYDMSAMIFCLMVRKEFGQDKFHWFLRRSSADGVETALKEVLGFDGIDDFDRTFRRYMIDLTRDVRSNKTPDSYLQIREKTD